jgi:lysozyme
VAQLTVSEAQIARTKLLEGYTAVCQCLPGDAATTFTWGFGQTGCVPGQFISEAEADALLRAELGAVTRDIYRNVRVPLDQNQLDGLADFVMNVGDAAFGESTLLKELNGGKYGGADSQFGRWIYANGKILAGLVTRRKEDAWLFAHTFRLLKRAIAAAA